MATELLGNLFVAQEQDPPLGGKFHGYRSRTVGVDGALASLKKYAETNGRPIVVVWVDDSYDKLEDLINDFNDGSDYGGDRYLLANQNHIAGDINTYNVNILTYGCEARFGWFQGSPTSPTAVKEARDFCLSLGGSSSDKVIVAIYWPLKNDSSLKAIIPENLISQGQNYVGNYWGRTKGQLVKMRKQWQTQDDNFGNIDNALYDVSSNFVSNQWYKYDQSSSSLQSLIDYANTNKLPVIFVGSQFGCTHCTDFHDQFLTSSGAIEFFKTTDCILLYGWSGSGWWSAKDDKVFVDQILEGKGYSTPITGVWYQGKIVGKARTGGTNYSEMLRFYIDTLALIDTWDGGDGGESDPDAKTKTFYVTFDTSSADSGFLERIEVVARSEDYFKGSATLPTKTIVTSRLKKSGHQPSRFKATSSQKQYAFGAQIEVSANLTLEIVWEAEDSGNNKGESGSSSKKIISPTKVTVYQKDKFPAWYKYGEVGEKTTRVSNNVSALQVIGQASGGTRSNKATEQLVEVHFNDKLSEVAPSAFMECKNLGTFNAYNIKSVGDYAFYGCKSLTNAEFLGTGNKVLTHIGDYAFAGSGLKNLVINLQGSVSDSSTNTHCFSNCTELTSIDMTNSTYLADHMFDGCTKLQKVNLNNYHSYINEYAFANCVMLTGMTLPAKTYMLPDHMFDGCTNLMQVKFQEPSDLRQLGEGVFAGCSRLTSITLPASVSSLEYIDPLFLSGSSIDRVVFNGISDDVFADEIREPKEYALPPSVLYEDVGKIKTILKDVLTSNIPVIAIRSNDNGCSICGSYKAAIYGTSKFKKWLTTQNKYYWVLAYCDSNNAGYNAITDFLDKHCNRWGTHYLQVGFYWKKDDGTEVTAFFEGSQAYSGKYSTIDKYIDQLENHVFKGYEGEGEIIYVTKDEITTFGRGQDLSVTFVSSTGREWICANDSVIYVPETRVDHYTTSDFKYGIWYYNIRELKAFADANNLPLLLEFGSRGCDPCVDFKKNTFNNQEFQTTIASMPCLLCKIEIGNGEAFDKPTTTQAYYASHEFGDPKTYIPQLVYYWKKASGETYKKIWNYNYRSDPGNANYQTVLAKLDEMLGDYTGDARFVAPTIQSMNNNKYRFYERDSEDDLEGRYFVCDRKTSESTFSDCTLSVSGFPLDGESGMKSIETVVLTSISLEDTVNIPDGAYQYFTVEDSSRYHDLSGIIFTIADRMVIGLCKFENEVGATYSPDDGANTGYWTHFNDNSTAESIATQIQKYESTSTPMVVFERASTIGATATFVPKSGSGSAQTQTFQIDIDSAKSQDDISALVRAAIGSDNTLQAISNMDELANLQRFNSQIRYGSGFTSWAKKRKYGLVDIASNSWSVGAPSKFREFESSTNFDGNTTSDPLPKFLVYHGCSTCTIDGSTVIYCKKKIEVDFTKNLNYYTSLIDEYASLTGEV